MASASFIKTSKTNLPPAFSTFLTMIYDRENPAMPGQPLGFGTWRKKPELAKMIKDSNDRREVVHPPTSIASVKT